MNGATGPKSVAERRNLRDLRETKAVLVLVIAASMLLAIAQSLDWFRRPVVEDAFSEMTHLLFGLYIVPFEVLGFLLLAALIGALYLATREATPRA